MAGKLDEIRAKMAQAIDNAQNEGVMDLRKKKYRDIHKKERDHIALAKTMHKVRTKLDKLKDQVKELEAEHDVLRIELMPTLMEDQGLENFRVAGLGRVQLTPDIYCSSPTGKKAELFTWLEQQNMADLIQKKVESSTLRASMKDRIKAGKELPPADVVKVTLYTRASIVKA